MTQHTGTEDDVVTLLKRQHVRIRELFDEMTSATGERRRVVFRELVRMLAMHETAEEEVVHPAARRAFEQGPQVVDARLVEERSAKEMLSRLDRMDIDDPDFAPQLTALRQAVLDHADAEERLEFPLLSEGMPADRLARMAKAVRAAEKMAPTHPHPGVESMAANLTVGPFAALMDRTRDAVRKVMGKED
ncbi:hemerythrin domain-containing protein [Streptantibioticus cattleyicolor]|uniref:Hemerythrin-like domain-containing protein n=1 Tax=Streptantibioticus cattleyicolor (strain ATCC 35852 / DSM 46488 / JCM 4925 / NBRC 14057 / NRRL 8057) TaxID=1003195 RepID=F8JM72_STREN|nr:hemerythrin domain-containing protein [Streptantibioticus cattleyicolor]AEW99399.1 hypothetical protein SCATT_p12060 [Streptantibioticus cattleyicolor NRRL 8057 = DSM 46488]CCB71560.1 conserved protein of unknown function [Streptantibioticus cattleyicolor NRRL 8057 = DSM 46488]